MSYHIPPASDKENLLSELYVWNVITQMVEKHQHVAKKKKRKAQAPVVLTRNSREQW